MNHIKKIARLLRTSERVILDLEKKMNQATGRLGILEEIVMKNNQRVKETLFALKLKNPTAEQVFSALIEKAKETDKKLFNHFQKPNYSTETGCEVLIDAVKKLTGKLEGFYLKRKKAEELLGLNPPKNIMAALGYGTDIKELLKNEDIFEIFSALRFVENSRWLNDVFFKPYRKLTEDDFELREIKTMVLPRKWLGIGQKFLGQKLHHTSHLKELGIVFIIPIAEQVSGEILYLFFMILHYLYEVDWHARLFRSYSRKKDFASKIVDILRVEVSGEPLPNHNQASWRVMSKYLAKSDSNDPRLFEPHINTEAWHYYRANLAIERFSKQFSELGLDFWQGLNVVGEHFPSNCNGREILISFDMFDVGIALLQQIGFESKYLYHQQEALWTEVFRNYLGEEKTDKIMMDYLNQGYVII